MIEKDAQTWLVKKYGGEDKCTYLEDSNKFDEAEMFQRNLLEKIFKSFFIHYEKKEYNIILK